MGRSVPQCPSSGRAGKMVSCLSRIVCRSAKSHRRRQRTGAPRYRDWASWVRELLCSALAFQWHDEGASSPPVGQSPFGYEDVPNCSSLQSGGPFSSRTGRSRACSLRKKRRKGLIPMPKRVRVRRHRLQMLENPHSIAIEAPGSRWGRLAR
jgi:hypothetical protein